MPEGRASELREDALARAKVWRQPAVPIDQVDLLANPPGDDSFHFSDEVVCKFHPEKVGGATRKFNCILAGGEVIRVKYGRNPEVRTEVVVTRLLEALGFGADRMYVVRKVRCFGCPEDPFKVLSCVYSPSEQVRKECQPLYVKKTEKGKSELNLDYAKYTDFDMVALERRMEGKGIEVKDVEGWKWSELEKIDPARGGATRAEIDALRLMAALVNNWDTKAGNQRLICLPGGEGADGSCTRPFALMQDVGGTFGREKLDLEAWRAIPIWKDAGSCVVEIESPPLHSATFRDVAISESGRRFLAGLLTQLSEKQVKDLFIGGRAPGQEDNWAQAFQEKVRQIAQREPCPGG